VDEVTETEPTLIPAQRRKLISEYLQLHQVARLSTLCDLLRASEATVRRDLEWLETQGLLERTHGGATLSQRMPREPGYSRSALAHPDEKRWIGKAAAALVEEGDMVFLNSGTTTTEVMRNLRARPDLSHITVITSNVTAASEARDAAFEILLLGGTFRPQSNATAGRFAIGVLEQVYANKAFIGVDGISLNFHCTTPASAEAEIASTMIERTRGLVAVVADHSKWGVVSNFELAKIDQIQALIVDEGLGQEARAQLQARGVTLILACSEPGAARGIPPRDDQEKTHATVLEAG
jgi:DeoR/GlpR family transcriptional regulator of sugar metabolism